MPTVPLFPLRTVLVPGLVLPLHIFEPRYRLMIRTLLEQPEDDRGFGIVALRPGVAESDGPSALYDVGTMARITTAEALPDGRYREFNFSPSGQWAAYDFHGYRTGMSEYEPAAAPRIETDQGLSVSTLTVFLPESEFADVQFAALCAVIEEQGGQKSYWAARHAGEKPDFHNPACFILPVP